MIVSFNFNFAAMQRMSRQSHLISTVLQRNGCGDKVTRYLDLFLLSTWLRTVSALNMLIICPMRGIFSNFSSRSSMAFVEWGSHVLRSPEADESVSKAYGSLESSVNWVCRTTFVLYLIKSQAFFTLRGSSISFFR